MLYNSIETVPNIMETVGLQLTSYVGHPFLDARLLINTRSKLVEEKCLPTLIAI